MRAVDTNLLVRLVVRDDAEQVTRAEAYVERGGWVSHLALAEMTWVLETVYERDARSIATAIERLVNHRSLAVQDAEIVAAALAHFRKRPPLGFSDCLLLEVARKAGHLPLGTFDRDLARLPGAEHV